jgi:putative FmdB family regulatory protein
MPLYEYRCDKCGNLFEVIQKFSDAPLTSHDDCGGAVHRLISPPAIQFKGSGWYVTDYARAQKSNGSKAEGEKKSEPAGEKKTETKTESKPETSATKSESKP